MDTFTSPRSARIAFGKAERTWKAARDARINAEQAKRSADGRPEPTAEDREKLNALRADFERLQGEARYACPSWGAYLDLENEINDRPVKLAQAAEDEAWDRMKAIYDSAEAQGIFIRSYELNYNPTRDLILQNID